MHFWIGMDLTDRIVSILVQTCESTSINLLDSLTIFHQMPSFDERKYNSFSCPHQEMFIHVAKSMKINLINILSWMALALVWLIYTMNMHWNFLINELFPSLKTFSWNMVLVFYKIYSWQFCSQVILLCHFLWFRLDAAIPFISRKKNLAGIWLEAFLFSCSNNEHFNIML